MLFNFSPEDDSSLNRNIDIRKINILPHSDNFINPDNFYTVGYLQPLVSGLK